MASNDDKLDQADGDQLKRRIDDIMYRGRFTNCGQVTLAQATSTTVTKQARDGNISSNSVILLMPSNSSCAGGDITYISPGKDTFTINHTSPGGLSKLYSYIVFTGWKTSNEP